MLRNNNYQQISEKSSSIPSSTKEFLRSQQKDIVCTDCGGISTTKVQQLLSSLDDTAPLSTNTIPNPIRSRRIYRKQPNRSISTNKKKKKNSARNNSQKSSLRRNMKKKSPPKQRKSSKKSNRSSLTSRNNNNTNKNRFKSKRNNSKN
ncbi:hypothetical protein I4U23_011926 [Adineta vaga]|nr:hypothetical protein I4U23_011926 [Adineta vaga]